MRALEPEPELRSELARFPAFRDLPHEVLDAMFGACELRAYEPGAIARFRREADLLLELEHPHVARVFRRFTAFGTNFIVMEFCAGRSLDVWIRDRGPMREREARRVVGQLASALVYLHSHGVVHRDLKPSNVMLTDDLEVRLTDFGLAKTGSMLPAVTPDTSVEEFAGTPAYMAPEQMRGAEADPSTDLYALGCLTFELLTGQVPFRATSLRELTKQKRRFALPPRRSIGRGVSCRMHRFLSACLAPDPAMRRVDPARVATWR